MLIWQLFSLLGFMSVLGNFWQFVTNDRLRNVNSFYKTQQAELQATCNELAARCQELIVQVTQLEGNKNNLEEKLRMEQTIEQRSCEKAELYCAKLSDKSSQALIQNSKEFAEQIEGMLRPLKEDIVKFQNFNAAADSRIEHLNNINNEMKSSMEKLTNAMSGNSAQAGRWGEYMLEHCLSSSGLQKGRHYELQYGICSGEDEDEKIGRPDAVMHLPDGKLVIIDAKVSLSGHRHYADGAESKVSHADAEKQKKDLILSIRNHIQTLKEREYHKSSKSAVESVLMFVPSESVFTFIVQNGLWHEAAKKGVSVVSPTTLPIVLNLIYLLWRNKDQEVHAQQIADSATKLYEKFVGVCEAWSGVGENLNKVLRTYNFAVGRMSGQGGLRYRIADLKSKGIASNKELPEIPLADVALKELPEMLLADAIEGNGHARVGCTEFISDPDVQDS